MSAMEDSFGKWRKYLVVMSRPASITTSLRVSVSFPPCKGGAGIVGGGGFFSEMEEGLAVMSRSASLTTS